MRFETIEDISREIKAALLFKNNFNNKEKYKFIKQEQDAVDIKIIRDKTPYGYAEIKGRNYNIKDAFPLPVAIRKLNKLQNLKGEIFLIWACIDGIIVSRLENLNGVLMFGGRKPRDGSYVDRELMAYFDDNKNFKKIYYENN